MDKKQAIAIAISYIESLKGKFDVRSALFFSSFAKGTNHDDSDIDIAIVLNHVRDIIDIQVELMKLRRKIDLRIEPHPIDYKNFNRSNPVVNEILKCGISIPQSQA